MLLKKVRGLVSQTRVNWECNERTHFSNEFTMFPGSLVNFPCWPNEVSESKNLLWDVTLLNIDDCWFFFVKYIKTIKINIIEKNFDNVSKRLQPDWIIRGARYILARTNRDRKF